MLTVFSAHFVEDAVATKAAADRILGFDLVDNAAVAAQVVGHHELRREICDSIHRKNNLSPASRLGRGAAAMSRRAPKWTTVRLVQTRDGTWKAHLAAHVQRIARVACCVSWSSRSSASPGPYPLLTDVTTLPPPASQMTTLPVTVRRAWKTVDRAVDPLLAAAVRTHKIPESPRNTPASASRNADATDLHRTPPAIMRWIRVSVDCTPRRSACTCGIAVHEGSRGTRSRASSGDRLA